MSSYIRSARDAFTLSLGGMRTIAGFATVTTVADDRINKAIAKRLSEAQSGRPEQRPIATDGTPSYWLSDSAQAELRDCA